MAGAQGEASGRPLGQRSSGSLDSMHNLSAEESRVNQDLGDVMAERLDANRRSVEKLLALLQAVTAAEAAYSRAMVAAANVQVMSESDGDGLRTAVAGFSELLLLIGHAHKQVHEGLAESTKHIHAVVGQLRQAFSSVQQDCSRSRQAVEAAQQQLRQARQAHTESTTPGSSAKKRSGFGLTISRLSGGMGAAPSGEPDPWTSEAALVSAYGTLSVAASAERQVLVQSYDSVKRVEEQRLQLIKDGFNRFIRHYRAVLLPMTQDLAEVASLTSAISTEAELADLADTMRMSEDTGRVLAERQAAVLGTAQQELLCSPDILRQGQMAWFDPVCRSWVDCHFILTRGGRLHWFGDLDGMQGGDCITLARCGFEAGEAPVFSLVERGAPGKLLFPARQRRLSFKAPTVEECCEWAIAMREAISRSAPGAQQ